MKEQGSAALRIVAFAVALAVVLGLSSVMFQLTASAEASSSESDISTATDYDKDISVGTLKNYSCLQLGYSSEIDYLHLRNLYYASSSPYMFYTLFGVDSSDNLVALTSNIGSKYTSNNYTGYQYANIPDTYYLGKLYKFKLGFSVSLSDSSFMCFNMYKSNFDSDNFNQYVTYSSFDKSLYSKFYLVYTGSSDNSNAALTSFVSDVSSNINGSDFKDSSITTPSAEFVSCKSAPTGYPEGVLWFEDWIKEGMQYPYFSWYIRDNGNKHSYSVKFSYNSSQVDTCDKVFNNRFYDELENVIQNPLFLFAESGVIYAASKLKWLAEQSGLLTNITAIQWKNLSYTDSFALSSDDMDFTSCDNSGNRVFSVCLSDYSDIGRYFIYRADIIDNVTGQVLDTTFFCPLNKFTKGNSGYGSKIYDYVDNGDGMLDDLINNTPSVDPSIKNPFDISGDVIDNNYGGGSISDINISDISSSLESSVNSVSVFFRFCWTLFPSQIWTVILLGLSLIIILRVLGR